MVDSVEFRSGEFEKAAELGSKIMAEDDRAISIPQSAHTELTGSFDKLLNYSHDSAKHVLSLNTGQEDTIYILSHNTIHFENYGTFVFFEEPIHGIYFTTGGSAIDLVIELIFKLTGLHHEGESEIYTLAAGAADYIHADIEYPDIGMKEERTEVEIKQDGK